MSARALAVFLGALAVIGLLSYGLLTKGSSAVAVGQPIPDLELPKLDGTGSGGISEHRGKWVLINIWASWCGPCREESPALQRFYEEHRNEDFLVLGIDTEDLTSDALEFVEEFELTYPQLHDGEGNVSDELGVVGVPWTLLVDPEGEVALVEPRPVTDGYLRDEVAPLIEGS